MNSITKTVNVGSHIVSVTISGAVDFSTMHPSVQNGLYGLAKEIIEFNISNADTTLESGSFNMTRNGRYQVAWGLESVDYVPVTEGALQSDAIITSADGWSLKDIDEDMVESDEDYAGSLIGNDYRATAAYHYDAESTSDYRDSFSIRVAA